MIELALPDNWQEIFTADKKIMQHGDVMQTYYVRLMEVLNAPYPDEGACKLEAVKLFSGLNGKQIAKEFRAATPGQRRTVSKKDHKFAALQIVGEAFPALDFIFNKEPFLQNPIPEFEHNGILYEGPASKLLNQTGNEWSLTHHAHLLYHQTKDEKHLNNIIAANYHRVTDGNRCELNKKEMAEDAIAFATLSVAVKMGIWLFYNHCEDWWNEQFKLLYGEGEAGEELTGKETWELMFQLSDCSLGTNLDRVMLRTRQEIYMGLDKLESNRLKAIEQSSN